MFCSYLRLQVQAPDEVQNRRSAAYQDQMMTSSADVVISTCVVLVLQYNMASTLTERDLLSKACSISLSA